MARDILIIGAGRIGLVISDMLAGSGAYRVTLADRDVPASPAGQGGVHRLRLDVEDGPALRAALIGRYAVISALPFHKTAAVARAAAAGGVHYLDLTEDVATTRLVRQLAAGAAAALIPQCGLAPGFVAIVARDLIGRFEQIDSLRLRTGALPQFPANALHYNLTWSPEGVINEYCEPCEAIVGGQRVLLPALDDCEDFVLDGVAYEAFNTSGGLGNLVESLSGPETALRDLSYRSIRYPGHARLMKLLLQDLRLRERRDLLRDILEAALPATQQDVVIVFVTAIGRRAGRLEEESFVARVHGQALQGQQRSAIQITTAAGVCAVLDLLQEGVLPQQGFVAQDQIALSQFLQNRFGRIYCQPAAALPMREVA